MKTKKHLEQQIKDHEETIRKLTLRADRLMSDNEYYVRESKTRVERIEKLRAALESLLRATVELNEMIVEARFAESGSNEALAKMRALINKTVTKEMFEMTAPPYSSIPQAILIGGAGLLFAAYASYFMFQPKKSSAAPAAPAGSESGP